jgi:hypothetical protein
VIILFSWGFWGFIRKNGVSSSYWGALIIAEILILGQGALGTILYFIGLQPERGGMHVLYGIVGSLGIPAVLIFTKGRNDRQTLFVYTAVLLLIAVIFIRSIVTG